MLAHVLALAVGLGSFTLYMAAFFFPEVHRKHDFFWSGLGLFYALVLWACAGQMTGAVLLGQVASVALLGWLGWQTLVLRRVKTPLALQTPATAESWQGLRDEMTGLFQDFASQTPLGKVFGFQRRAPGTQGQGPNPAKIRASSIREVGYEYLDEVATEAEQARFSQPNPSHTAQRPSAGGPPAIPTAATPRTRAPRPAQLPPVGPDRPQSQPSGLPPNSRSPLSGVNQVRAKAVVLKDWLVDLAGSLSRPKPSRPAIEIPPREPSIPLAKPAPVLQTDAPGAVAQARDLEEDEFWDDGGESTPSPENSAAATSPSGAALTDLVAADSPPAAELADLAELTLPAQAKPAADLDGTNVTFPEETPASPGEPKPSPGAADD